jgi:hypothetical protein
MGLRAVDAVDDPHGQGHDGVAFSVSSGAFTHPVRAEGGRACGSSYCCSSYGRQILPLRYRLVQDRTQQARNESRLSEYRSVDMLMCMTRSVPSWCVRTVRGSKG